MNPSISTEETIPRLPGRKAQKLAGTLVRVHEKGYGFIRLELKGHLGHATEYYIHINDFPDRSAWKVDQPVFFEVAMGNSNTKAPRAIKVTLAASSFEEEWWDVLECRSDASVDVIEAQYKARVRTAHPDTGGSDTAMARLNVARDRALAERKGA